MTLVLCVVLPTMSVCSVLVGISVDFVKGLYNLILFSLEYDYVVRPVFSVFLQAYGCSRFPDFLAFLTLPQKKKKQANYFSI